MKKTIHIDYMPRTKEEVQKWHELYLANGGSAKKAGVLVGKTDTVLYYWFKTYGFPVRKRTNNPYILLDGIRFYPSTKNGTYQHSDRDPNKRATLSSYLKNQYGWKSINENIHIIIQLLKKGKSMDEISSMLDDIYKL